MSIAFLYNTYFLNRKLQLERILISFPHPLPMQLDEMLLLDFTILFSF